MHWMRRLLIGFPFAIAATLDGLLLAAERFHWRTEHFAGYCFLFATPWTWLLDWGWIPIPHNRVLQHVVGSAVLLWIPAALYSACLWLVFVGIQRVVSRKKTPTEVLPPDSRVI
jgi:hypothetical protein